jgi:hypothetical protein
MLVKDITVAMLSWLIVYLIVEKIGISSPPAIAFIGYIAGAVAMAVTIVWNRK